MPRPALESMLLASTDPDRLAEWYATAFEPQEDAKVDQYRLLRFDRFYLMIDRRDNIAERNPDPARMIVNFDVDDARAVVGRLEQLGTTWVAELEDRDGSLFATATDPDGNHVQLVQLSPQHLAEMSGHSPDSPVAAGEPFSGFAVADLEAARRFYGEVLGLRVSSEGGLLRLQLGNRDVLIYPKPDHRPANYTILNFPVEDIERAVDDLAARGVTFERYDGFSQDERGIARGDQGPPIAWFTDPSGNILSVLQ